MSSATLLFSLLVLLFICSLTIRGNRLWVGAAMLAVLIILVLTLLGVLPQSLR